MLSRENVGFASTCNTIGQTLGFFISQVGFLALYDPDVCNKYFRWVLMPVSTTKHIMSAPEYQEVEIGLDNIILTDH